MIVEIYSHGEDDDHPYYRVVATDAQARDLERIGKETGFLVRVSNPDRVRDARQFMLGFVGRSLEGM